MKTLFRTNNGEQSNTTTLLWLSWIFAIFFIVMSMVDIDKAVLGVSVRPVDASVILFLLGPITGLYGYRRKCEHSEMKEIMEKLKK